MSNAVVGNDRTAVVDDEPVIVKIEAVEGQEPNVVIQSKDAGDNTIYTCNDGEVRVKTIVLDSENGNAPTSQIFISKDGDGSAKGQAIIVDGKAITLPGGPDGALSALFASTGKGRNIEAGGPWLGIQFGPVSKPLMSHLDLGKNVGQMILNVVEGSPADIAGFEQYDVIVSVDGGDVSSSIAKFMDVIRAFEPDDSVVFGLIRGGQGLTSNLIVGTRPETTGKTTYKYETTIEELTDGQELFRGGWLKKGEGGEWMFNNFDQKDVVDVWKMMPNDADWPGSGSSAFKFYSSPGSSSLPHSQLKTFIWSQRDAENVRVETKDDGTIVVSRTEKDENGDEVTTTKTYANEDELMDDDPEAAKMIGGKNMQFFVGKGPHSTIDVFGGGSGKDYFLNSIPSFGESATINLDSDRLLEKIREAIKQSENMNGTLDTDDLRERIKALDIFTELRAQHGNSTISSSSKVVVSFMLDETGKIRVTTREGDSEITHVFKDAKAMKEARPDLFGKYNKLHSGNRTEDDSGQN